MKPLLLILLAASVAAQTGLDWRRLANGENVKVYVAEIARGEKEVKFWLRFDFPNGAPANFPVANVGSVRIQATFNCEKKTGKLTKEYGYFYDRYGAFIKRAKDGETVKGMSPDSVGGFLLEYFCEQPSKSSPGPPKMKKKS